LGEAKEGKTEMEAFMVGFAVLAGILLGFWLRSADARAERAILDQRNHELEDALAKLRGELKQHIAETGARAGFESLATEREKIIGQMTVDQERLRADLQAKAEEEKTQAARVSELEADLRNERQNLTEKVALLDAAKESLTNHFEKLTGEILEKKAKSFSAGSQSGLGNMLESLREQIKDFRERVEKVQIDSNSGVTKIETLIGSLGDLNQQLAAEARNLTTALRGSAKAKGDWDEFILPDLLEKAGLREGEQYSFQQSFRDAASEDSRAAGSEQMDVIVHLPGGRHLVIDSKVPLDAYLDSVNAELEHDRAAAAREYLKSVRHHIAGVAGANYHGLEGIQTPDFVMTFVPIEPALLAALQGDSELWADAYAQGVLLAGPTTLLYVIRMVSMLWRQDDHNRIVKELTDHGMTLYAKFAEFATDMDSLGEGLRNASARYDVAKKKLSDGRDSLVCQFEEFKSLSVQPKLTQMAEPIAFKWAAASSEDRELKFGSEDGSEQLELTAETNGYHHERAEELELEEVPYSTS
jgi:DNA recombination protein RmuC